MDSPNSNTRPQNGDITRCYGDDASKLQQQEHLAADEEYIKLGNRGLKTEERIRCIEAACQAKLAATEGQSAMLKQVLDSQLTTQELIHEI